MNEETLIKKLIKKKLAFKALLKVTRLDEDTFFKKLRNFSGEQYTSLGLDKIEEAYRSGDIEKFAPILDKARKKLSAKLTKKQEQHLDTAEDSLIHKDESKARKNLLSFVLDVWNQSKIFKTAFPELKNVNANLKGEESILTPTLLILVIGCLAIILVKNPDTLEAMHITKEGVILISFLAIVPLATLALILLFTKGESW
jgi:hypothetical protein